MSLNPDECEFKQEDLCSFDGPCRFRGPGWECTVKESGLMTEEEYEAMQELSDGVQKIFEDAVKGRPPVSFPVENPERERERKRTYSTYVCIYASVFLLFLKISIPVAMIGGW